MRLYLTPLVLLAFLSGCATQSPKTVFIPGPKPETIETPVVKKQPELQERIKAQETVKPNKPTQQAVKSKPLVKDKPSASPVMSKPRGPMAIVDSDDIQLQRAETVKVRLD